MNFFVRILLPLPVLVLTTILKAEDSIPRIRFSAGGGVSRLELVRRNDYYQPHGSRDDYRIDSILTRPRFSTSVTGEYKYTRYLSVSADLKFLSHSVTYSESGRGYYLGAYVSSSETKIKIDYSSLAFALSHRFYIKSLFVNVGAWAARPLYFHSLEVGRGTIIYFNDTGGVKSKEEKTYSSEVFVMHKTDGGLTAAIGLNIPIKKLSLEIKVQKFWGLQRLTENPSLYRNYPEISIAVGFSSARVPSLLLGIENKESNSSVFSINSFLEACAAGFPSTASVDLYKRFGHSAFSYSISAGLGIGVENYGSGRYYPALEFWFLPKSGILLGRRNLQVGPGLSFPVSLTDYDEDDVAPAPYFHVRYALKKTLLIIGATTYFIPDSREPVLPALSLGYQLAKR
jgi:hypothetical protein